MKLLPILVAAATLAPGRPLRHVWSEAFEIAGPRFVVETDTFPEAGRSLLDGLDGAYPLFEERFGPLEGRARRPMRVALFYGRESYMKEGGGVEGAAGHFDPALDRCAVAYRETDEAEGWPIAVHEACHHYLNRRHPDALLPSWYGEGIACWFEGLADPVSRGVARMRATLARETAAAGEADLPTLLLAQAKVGPGGVTLSAYSPARFYALSWSLVHYLATDPATRESFRRFELRLFASRPAYSERAESARRLLEEECGDLAAIERGWRAHLRDLVVPAGPLAAPPYRFELESENAYTRFDALRRLRGAALPSSLREPVLRCLLDDDFAVRAAAARAVDASIGARALPGLVRALEVADPTLRRSAVDALLRIDDPRSYAALGRALEDPAIGTLAKATIAERFARRAAAEAQKAAQLRVAVSHAEERPESFDLLLALLADASAPAARRTEACARLGRLGDLRAVTPLRKLCRPSHPEPIRLAALKALVAITGESRGYAPGQGARDREAAFRAWAAE